MVAKKIPLSKIKKQEKEHATSYSMRYFTEPIPKYKMPAESMPANVAYQLCHDEMNLDGNPILNLASFVNTWMEPEAEKLILESINKNFIDADEYPQSIVIHKRCVNMLLNLYNAPENIIGAGTSTIGSSEAIMLCCLTHKWNWREKRKAAGKSTDKPNIILGSNAQVVWDKFARFFDVEPRFIPLDPQKKRWIISTEEVSRLVDENTICVMGILGSTLTGEFEPIKEINDMLVKLKKEKGLDIPIHVDAASGGFVAPFIYPKLKWDFQLPQVKTINVSGHKYGLVYPGVGWALWKDHADIPDELVFHLNYLGGDMKTFSLNFSRGSSHIIAQYYNFLRLGKKGYCKIMTSLMQNTKYLSQKIKEMGEFEIISNDQSLPLITFTLKKQNSFSVFDISHKLRERGWIVPAYKLAPNAEKTAVLRIVLRESFSRDLAEILANDLKETIDYFKKNKPHIDHSKRATEHKIC